MNIRILHPQSYSHNGQKPNQEDSLFPPLGRATKDTRVFLVCDGMGGHENGEVASSCVAETIGKMTYHMPKCSSTEMKQRFEESLSEAYRNLNELDHSESSKKMGTTLTFLAICSDGILVAHIGDSRVYQFRPDEGIVFQTRDHSLVNDLIAAGELSTEEARTFPQRNVITRAIQPHQEYPAKATYSVLTDIRKGDIFLMCCDGVIEQLDNDDLCSLILSGKPIDKKLESVKNECINRSTRDNHTAYMIEIASVNISDRAEDDKANEDITLTASTTPSTIISKHKILVFLLSAIIVIFLALIFLSASNSKKGYEKAPQTTEQVQGTIKRHTK